MDHELINQSIDYIIQNFDQELTVKDIAEHFHFSESYFSRCFRATTGYSVYELIKRLRMDQSAIDIKLIKERSITDIGLDYGYSASNFSSAFKKHHNISPAQFRRSSAVKEIKNPFYPEGSSQFDTYEDYERNIRILELKDQTAVYERVIGNYYDLKEKWFSFVEVNHRYIHKDTLYIERFYDDPTISDQNSCIYDVCITVNQQCTADNMTIIHGGRYAAYHYEGLICDIFCSVQGVFDIWLPASGYVMDQRFALNIYPEINRNCEAVIMDLCIPIQ